MLPAVTTLDGMFDPDRLGRHLTATGPRAELTSPGDGRRIATVPTSLPADISGAAGTARAAQPDWAARDVRQRAAVLLAFHDRLLDRRDEFVDLIQLEAGKSRLSAVEETLHVALTARYYARTAERYLRAERGSGLFPVLTRIDRNLSPKGLIGVIGPWNYPLTMSVSDALTALVAGNAVLIKPDAQTPLSTLAAGEVLADCGLPGELWQVVNGPGPEVGPALIDAVDYVCFTGSTATGRRVGARCAERLIGCSLELGGKNPLLVLDDADLGRAVPGAVRACFANSGQLCVSIERLYVDRGRWDEFTAAFVARTAALRLGTSGFDSDLGCLISRQQLERVEAHVADARAKGATVLTGGRSRPDLGPLFYEPTVLTGVTAEMACYAEETFGPVVSLYPVDDEAEAIARANDSPYGLNASVWTADRARGRRVAAAIACGTVNVNEGFAATFGSLDAPMGGMKSSGLGRRQGREGIRRFVDVQAVATQTGLPLAPVGPLNARRFTGAVTGAMRLMRRLGRP